MHKLLIANRGEIARRIMRTARRMGIDTVAVYSDADEGAAHVREADEAVRIGPAPAAESYLVIDRIIDAARQTGAAAVHPGYGFLSENAEFARALDAAGIVFVGPPAGAIEKMGLKDAAKAIMKKAGVPVTPGYQGDDQSLPRLEQAAKAIGYPLLIKAVAGGGGKGMRRVDDQAGFAEALIAAKREAETSFGNEDVLIERLIQRPRHVEVQVFADSHGNAVHLFERDCSLQRRHQKVVEEAPAPGLPDETRSALGAAAVRAAEAIDYRGAGTVEFILDTQETDENGNNLFYFMEMNTRLQVEHPVTEFITGTDLVEWQIRVARGEALPLSQDELAVGGHAVEARLYAEDAEAGFLPSTGTLTALEFPAESRSVRIDSGVEEGDEVSVHYDPMIAKLIAHGPDRETAIDRLVRALDGTVVEGPKNNRAFLARLVDHDAFRAAELDTGFIERHMDDLSAPRTIPEPLVAAAALARALPRPSVTPASAFERHAGWRMNLPARRYVDLFTVTGGPFHIELVRTDEGFVLNGLSSALSARAGWTGAHALSLVLDGEAAQAFVFEGEDWLDVRMDGSTQRFATTPERLGATAAGDGTITAPMPGRILNLDVEEGETVAAGARLMVLEAMKMENRITAPVAGRVTALSVGTGDQVTEGMVLMKIESEE